VDKELARRHRVLNRLQSVLLLAAMAGLLAFRIADMEIPEYLSRSSRRSPRWRSMGLWY
jgi:hypothetical protein